MPHSTLIAMKILYYVFFSIDDNVHYQQTMMLTVSTFNVNKKGVNYRLQNVYLLILPCFFMIKQRALEEADVLFQQLSYPDENHGLVGLRPHFYHSLSNFILNDCFGRNEVFKK